MHRITSFFPGGGGVFGKSANRGCRVIVVGHNVTLLGKGRSFGRKKPRPLLQVILKITPSIDGSKQTKTLCINNVFGEIYLFLSKSFVLEPPIMLCQCDQMWLRVINFGNMSLGQCHLLLRPKDEAKIWSLQGLPLQGRLEGSDRQQGLLLHYGLRTWSQILFWNEAGLPAHLQGRCLLSDWLGLSHIWRALQPCGLWQWNWGRTAGCWRGNGHLPTW